MTRSLPALLSMMAFRFMRGYFRLAFQSLRWFRRSRHWQLLLERLETPAALPYIMLNAPRWNTHALIATAGPFRIRENALLRSDNFLSSGRSRTLVLYRQPSNESILIDWQAGSTKHALSLAPGNYVLSCRVYEPQFPLSLPAFEADGQTLIPAREIKEPLPYYPPAVHNKSGGWYRFWHLHLLERLRQSPPNDPALQKEYLPVGNPETYFRFGYLPAGKRLTIKAPALQGRCLLYLSCYNDSSFPLFSATINPAEPFTSPLFEQEGSWLLRVIPLQGLTEAEAFAGIAVQLEPDL